MGTKSNRDGIGARVEVFAAGKRHTAERVAGSGYLSQDDEPPALRTGRCNHHRQAHRSLAQRARADAGKLSVDRVLTVQEPGERKPK